MEPTKCEVKEKLMKCHKAIDEVMELNGVHYSHALFAYLSMSNIALISAISKVNEEYIEKETEQRSMP